MQDESPALQSLDKSRIVISGYVNMPCAQDPLVSIQTSQDGFLHTVRAVPHLGGLEHHPKVCTFHYV